MPSIDSALAGRTLLVTGATGFLAKAFVEKVLRDLPETRLVLLIRPRTKAGRRIGAAERLEREVLPSSAFRRLRAELGGAFDARVAERVRAVEGDLTLDDLGLSSEDRSSLEDVDLLVNSAATVVFDEKVDDAVSLNTRGVGRLLGLARSLGDVPLVHVSTAYVCGRVEGTVPEVPPSLDRVVADDLEGRSAGTLDLDAEIGGLDELAAEARREAEQLDPRRLPGNGDPEERRRRWLKDRLVEVGMARARERGWNDTYTYTKSLGERCLVRDHGSVPACIVRPAIIESSLAEPEPGWIDGLRMADPLFAAFGKGVLSDFPARPDAYVDFIPVDHVSHAMLAAAAELLEGAAEGRSPEDVPVRHVATSTANPLRFERLHELARGHFLENPMLGRDGRPATPADFSFVDERIFLARLERKQRLLSLARGAAQRLPGSASKRLAAKLARLGAQLDRILYYAKIYRPYCAFPARFDTASTEALFASLPDSERARFDFDPRGFDWETYLQDIHLPGLRRNVLREPSAPPMAHSAAADDDDGARAAPGGTRTVLHLAAESARLHGDQPAVRAFDGERIVRELTHAQVHERALGAGAALRKAGVGRGDRVILLSESRPEWIVAWLGIVAAGATAVPLDVQSSPERIASVARLTRAAATIASPDLMEKAAAAKAPHPLPIEEVTGTALDAESAAAAEIPAELSSETPASILFTSGTTLEPKGVVLPHRAFLANVESIEPVLKPTSDDRLVSVLPLHHAFEFTAGTLAPLAAGASITYLETLSSENVIAALRHVRATFLLGVPRLFELMLEGVRRQLGQLGAGASAAMGALTGASRAFSAIGVRAHGTLLAPIHQRFGGCVRAFVSGGSPLPPDVQRGFSDLGFTLVEGYGLTETAPVLTVNPLDAPRPGSVGKPLPGVDLRIHRPGADGVGEVIVRGPNVMAGYFEDAAATAQVIRSGWFHTGDLGRLDDEGRLHLTGRLKDLIVTSSGKNVYPDEVEAELADLPGVAESSVVGVHAGSGGGEEVHLAVVLEGDARSDEDDPRRAAVRRAVEERCARLPSHQRVSRIHFLDSELPKTPLMKVKRSAVRTLLEGEAPRQDASGGLHENETDPMAREMLELLARLTRRPVETIRGEHSLAFDLGVDSLMRVEIAASLEAAGGPRLDEESVQQLSTVRDLVEVVRAARADRGAATPRDAAERRRTTAGGAAPAAAIGNGSAGPPGVRLASRAAAPLVRAAWPLFYGGWLGLRVRGRENLPATGPFILAANHQSHLDAGAILTALGEHARRLHVVAARDYFFDTPLKGHFFAELLHAIPFDRRGDFRTGLDRCRAALRAGDALLIFPEGTRSPDGRLQEFRAGLGILALELDVPVVPALIHGTHEALPKGARLPRRRGISVTFGRPLAAERFAGDGGDLAYERWRSVVEAVRREIVHLADHGPAEAADGPS